MNAPHLHEEIVALLGHGTECHCKGDEHPNRPGRHWGNDIWIQDSRVPERNEIADHLRWLSDFIRPHEPVLQAWIKQGARIDLYFSYCCNEDHRGFGIPGDLLGVFSRLKIPLEVSIMT
jgi:hypothetical protein